MAWLMSVPTDRNPRIIVAEIACRILKENIINKSGFRPKLSNQKLKELTQHLNSCVQKLKYSYLPDDELINNETTEDIKNTAKTIYDAVYDAYHGRSESGAIKKRGVQESTVLWATKLLMRFPERLVEKFRHTIEAGIDMQVVGIRNIVQISDSKLFVSKVYNGDDDFTVVTNLQTLKPGMRVGVAFLPPVLIGGEVSEAMYLGDKEYPEDTEYGTYIYSDAEFGEVRNILKQEFMKKGK